MQMSVAQLNLRKGQAPKKAQARMPVPPNHNM